MDCKNPAGGARTGQEGIDADQHWFTRRVLPDRDPTSTRVLKGGFKRCGLAVVSRPTTLRQVYGAVTIDDGISGYCLVNEIARMTRSLETFDVQLALRLTKFGDHAAQLS